MTLHDQIADLLTDTAQRVATLTRRPDIARVDTDAAATLITTVLTGNDDNSRADTAADLYAIVCGAHPEPPPEWWATPLGRAIATSIGRDDSDAVSAAIAGQMLGVSRTQIYRLADDGLLDRHPDGGITRTSVMSRLART